MASAQPDYKRKRPVRNYRTADFIVSHASRVRGLKQGRPNIHSEGIDFRHRSIVEVRRSCKAGGTVRVRSMPFEITNEEQWKTE